MRGKGALGEAPCRTRALFGQGLEVDFHQALNRQDVGAHGATQRFLGDTLIGAVHGADPLGVFVMRIFGAEARSAWEFARVGAAADGERVAVKAGGVVIRRSEHLDCRALRVDEERNHEQRIFAGCMVLVGNVGKLGL